MRQRRGRERFDRAARFCSFLFVVCSSGVGSSGVCCSCYMVRKLNIYASTRFLRGILPAAWDLAKRDMACANTDSDKKEYCKGGGSERGGRAGGEEVAFVALCVIIRIRSVAMARRDT